MRKPKEEKNLKKIQWPWHRICLVIVISLMVMIPVLSLNTEASSSEIIVVGIGTLGGVESFGNDINSQGQVVGMSFTTELPYNNWHAFSWTEDNGMTDLNPLDSAWSQAKAVNDNGDIVGYYMPPSAFYDQACLWTANGEFIDLGVLWGGYGTVSYARDINNNGMIVGTGYTYEDAMSPSYLVGHAILWIDSPSGYNCLDIGTLPGGDMAWAYGVNDRNEVVGVSAVYNEESGLMEYHAFLWKAEKGMTDLGQLGYVDQGLCLATDINNRGQVVGHNLLIDYSGFTTDDNGFICKSKRGRVSPIRTPHGYASSYVEGINDRGAMVGSLWLDDYHSCRHAALWSSHGRCIDLGTLLGGYDSYAKSINSQGIVVGTSSGETPFGWGYQATIWHT